MKASDCRVECLSTPEEFIRVTKNESGRGKWSSVNWFSFENNGNRHFIFEMKDTDMRLVSFSR